MVKSLPMPEESIKDKIARDDHDTLIRVETVVNNMATDLKALADGSGTRLTSAEARIAALEKVDDETKPKEMLVTVTEHDRLIREFKTTLRNFNWLIGGGFASILILVGYLTRLFGLLN